MRIILFGPRKVRGEALPVEVSAYGKHQDWRIGRVWLPHGQIVSCVKSAIDSGELHLESFFDQAYVIANFDSVEVTK